MAINIKFDLMGNPESPTIILANRNGNKLGQLSVNADSIDLSDKFNDASELSFTLNKYIDGKLTPLWDKVVDFKLVYCKEWDTWFEIKVELDEATETIKTVFCTQLGQAELSQIMLYNIEINTDTDIERDDYKISILYDSDDPDASILHRLLKDKAPHYSIAYVSPTIAKIQRNFSFDGTSIYDAFQEIAEEIGCLFLYYASINEDGVLERKIAVHDLQQTCNNESCGYRGEFTDKCPKCGGTDITSGYGEDTGIFVSNSELASEGIQLVTDTDSVKNCFKLEGGDDLMTATIRNCNPNGTDYIWYFSDSMKEDMSEELVQKIESYDEKYKEFYNERVSNLETQLLSNYNALVDKYSEYNEDLQKISSPIKGYPALMNAYYNTIDLALYLESGLMPSVEISETNAAEQVGLLTSSALSPVAVNVEDVGNVSLATANSAVLSMAKIIVKSTYKVEIKTSTLSENKVWSGQFVVTNYSDEEDTATSETISITINNNTEEFLKQKIEKTLNKENTEDLSISGLFNTENYSHNEFCDELKKYALNPLKSFYDACEACLSILIDQGAGNQDEKPDLYESLYESYYNKSVAIANEIQTRENEIAITKGVYSKTDENNPILITKGLQQNIEECRNTIQAELNFETYLGETLWLEFCAYRREDKYSNDNYISDGLNNAEIFERALEFIDVAENEIYKSSELQHSISTTLNNLLAIPKFKSLVNSFKTGNWIRVQVDDKVYKLRLLEYGISFGDFNTIPVEFSDVAKIKNGTTDVQDILAQASSMATSYSSVQRQASQGGRAKTTIEEWISDGLSSANVQIQSNDTEDITLTKHGLLARSYDEVTDTYSPEQLKITHNIMAYTDDNWRTVRQAIGKHEYKLYDEEKKDFVDEVGYGMGADFVTAGVISGSQIIGGDIYSENYIGGVDDNGNIISSQGSYIDLNEGKFSLAGGQLKYDGNSLEIVGGVQVTDKGKIACWNISGASIYSDDTTKITDTALENDKLLGCFDNGNRMYFGIQGLSLGDKFKVEPDGTATMTEANIRGEIHAEQGGTIAGFNIGNTAIYNNTDSLTSTNQGIYLGTDGIRQYASEEANVTISNGVLNANGANITGTIRGSTIEGGSLLIGDKDNGYAAWISDEDGIFHAYGAVIEGDSSFSGTLSAVDIVGQSTLKVGQRYDDEGNIIKGAYLTWIGKDGILHAQGANIEGELHVANGGTVGGWNIDRNGISKGNVGMLSDGIEQPSLANEGGTSPIRFYAGAWAEVSEPIRTQELSFTSTEIGETLTQSISLSEDESSYCTVVEAKCLTTNKLHSGDVSSSVLFIVDVPQITMDGTTYYGSVIVDVFPNWVLASHITSLTCTNANITLSYLGNGKVRASGVSILSGAMLQGTITGAYEFDETLTVGIKLNDSTIDITLEPQTSGVDYNLTFRYIVGAKNQNFKVLEDGSLYANAANFKGHIEADSGNIGGLKIQNGGLAGYKLEDGDVYESFVLTSDGLNIYGQSASIEVGDMSIKQGSKYTVFSASNSISLQSGDEENPSSYFRFGGSGDNILQEIELYIYAKAVGTTLSPKIVFYAEASEILPVTRKLTFYYNITTYAMPYPQTASSITLTIPAGKTKSGDYTITASYDVLNRWIRFSADIDKVKTLLTPSGTHNTKDYKEVCMATNGGVTEATLLYEIFDWKGSSSDFLVNGNLILDKGKHGNLGSVQSPWEGLYVTTIEAGNINATGDINAKNVYYTGECKQKGNSDRRLKNTIQNLSDTYGDFFDDLHPVSYKFNKNPNKIHTGFIAQEVEESMTKVGLKPDDFAGLNKPDLDKDEEYYGLQYSEFIALCVNEIQKLKKRVNELENK